MPDLIRHPEDLERAGFRVAPGSKAGVARNDDHRAGAV